MIRAEIEGYGTLEFPDGTDSAVIRMTVQRIVEQGKPQRMAALPPERNMKSSIVHGGIDAAGALAQNVSRAAEAMGLPPGSEYPFLASPEIVDQAIARARSQTNKFLGAPNPQGSDLARTASSAALVTPLGGPVGTAASIPGRAFQAARAGGVQGVMQPVENAKDPLDFAKTKAFQGVTRAVIGGVSQPLLEGASNTIASLANSATSRVRGAMADTSENAAALYASQLMAQQGIKMNTLREEVQQSIIRDVQEAMRKYGGVNAAALGRKADFAELGIDPLKPWVTRDPVEWGQYKNLEAAKDAGEPLIRARADLDRKLTENIAGLRRGSTGDAYESGQVAGAALTRKHEAMRSKVDALYSQFRQVAPNVSADPKRMVNTILDGVEGDALGDFLSPGLRNLVNDFAAGKRPTTPDSLYRAQQVANAEMRKGGNEGRAAGYVARGIDNELEQMGRDLAYVGPEMAQAADLLKQARAAHRTLKTQEEAIPALKAVAEGKYAAEDFFTRYVQGADVREVAAMWANTGEEVKHAARSQLVDFLKKAAVGAGSDEAAPFRQAAFNEAISGPGMTQKIKIILGDRGLEQVQRIARSAEAGIRTPSGTRYNTSGTAMELMNLAKRSSGIPFVGPLVSEPASKLLNQAQASNMAKPASVGAGMLDPFYEEILKRARLGAGLLAPGLAGSVAGDYSR